MPTYDEETSQYLNPEFERRLSEVTNSVANVLIQTDFGEYQPVVERVSVLEGVEIQPNNIILDTYIPATVPVDSVGRIARIDGVVEVHHDQPVGVFNFNSVISSVQDFSLQSDPIRESISEAAARFSTPTDDLEDTIDMQPGEDFRFNFFQLPLGDPIRVGLSTIQRATGSNTSGIEHIPTSESVSWMLNGNVLGDPAESDTKVAVIDTGFSPAGPFSIGRMAVSESQVPGEPALDGNSHGTWVTNAVSGSSKASIWGTVDGVASGMETAHFKALNSFPGVGRTSWILKAMESANAWGADVVNMSLGGPLQGSVDDDPFCQVVDQLSKENAGDEDGTIWVVAAGNSGPDRWTIGSPGAAPKALTVASWSLTDGEPASFSSRGPQGKWYGDNRDRYSEDRSQVGDFEFIKPDLAVPGGGRANPELAGEVDEMLHQACVGWMEGINDGYKDARGSMKGTSMASPQAAGLVAMLYDAGIINTAREVKQAVSERDSVPDFQLADETARETVGGKNLAVGFGRLRESIFDVE